MVAKKAGIFFDGLMAFCKYGASEHQGVFNWTRFFFPFARVGAITRLCDLTAEFGKKSESDVKSVRNRVFPSQNGILFYIF